MALLWGSQAAEIHLYRPGKTNKKLYYSKPSFTIVWNAEDLVKGNKKKIK